ncbi:MAG: c-type cytochrome [Elusimicrobia bacterium]|nr:c-type cytochrome [Elusimicrobiota bacterium]
MIKLLLLSAFLARAGEAPSRFQKDAALFQAKCAKCHTIGRGDRVGPDLKGVSERRDKAWIVGFITKTGDYLDNDAAAKELLAKFNGVRMEATNLSEAQAQGVLSYIDAASKGTVGPEEEAEPEIADPATLVKTPDEGLAPWFPGIAAGLVCLALAVGAWQLGFHVPAAILLALSAGAGYWSLGGRRHHLLLGNQQGYAPAQPIAYSHATHAGKLKINCLYCHYGALRSDAAGVPPLSVCMNCHNVVRKSAGASGPSEEIARFAAIWEARASTAPPRVAWTRIHDLPDFVHFPHRVHVANNIRCQECHGPVQDMVRVRQAASLSMGWCVNCHRQPKSAAPSHWKRTAGPLDCAACHW